MNDTEIYESFGKKLKERRKELGLTQKDLANVLKITSSAVNHYENGNRKINIDMLNKMASCLDISVDELIGNENKQMPNYDKQMKRWYEIVGELNFNEKEFEELANYARYIVSKRKKW